MKFKLLPAISIGIAVLVIGGVAYAADRRKNAKSPNLREGEIREEEALKKELLGANELQEKFSQSAVDKKMLDRIARDKTKETALLTELTK